MKRDSKFTMMLSRDERLKLAQVAKAEGMAASTWLRRVILREHENEFGRKRGGR